MRKFIKEHIMMVIIIVLTLMFILLAFLLKDQNKTAGTKEVNQWYKDTAENGVVVTVFAQTTCTHCKIFKPVIESVKEEYDFKLYWFEMNKLNVKDKNTLMNTFELTDYSGTPYILVTNNGEVVSYNSGRLPEKELIDFLSEAGVIKTEENISESNE